ncbi:MAG: hypothetical protein H0U28_11650 [Nocardioidaceae bacterium]|nr:hypothetical protein [Nocardioidaceae bacterium]
MNVLAATLAGNFDVGAALGAGLLGGVAFLMVVTMGRAIGMTRMNFLEVLGTMMTPNAPKTTVYGVGLMAHLMASAGFGLAHAGILHAIGVTTVGQAAGWDLLIAAAHGAVVLMALPMMLNAMHPLVRKQAMEAPGVALTGFGAGTPIGSLMAHVAFGLVAGSVYAAAVL